MLVFVFLNPEKTALYLVLNQVLDTVWEFKDAVK